VERSRRPLRSPTRTDAEVEAKVVQLRQQEGWGAKAIRHVLERDQEIRLGRMTVHRILERHGQIAADQRHRPALTRFERQQPNQLWQMDFKGQFPMGKRQCFPLSVLDDHSRYLVGLQALNGHGHRRRTANTNPDLQRTRTTRRDADGPWCAVVECDQRSWADAIIGEPDQARDTALLQRNRSSANAG
jgi:transposase InsO family protein